ncbi:DUF4349 domain-containing protein [Parasphingorhabdus sp.]|uniref:DUF4349 domain-containing protein n=1 Tax=Parasphingorhabdus sp. TaxID=2709688 RepID=UPI0032643438
MRTALTAVSLLSLSLAACSGAGEHAAQYDLAEAEMAESAGDAAASAAEPMGSPIDQAPGAIPVSKPQIAYSYDFGFRLPAAEISKVQQAHITLCNSVPENGCQILNMSNSGGEGDYANGQLHLQVAAPKARDFGTKLASAIDESGGSQISSSITGEDLSKKIVDTEARLRSRELLSKRLTDLLATRKGTVAELVEAERAVTQVNEEIDRARSWLTEMRGRVAYSTVMVNYQSGAPGSGGFMRPIRDALGGLSSSLGSSVAVVITLIAMLAPWLLLIGLGVYLRRRFKSANRTFFGRAIEDNGDVISQQD